MKLRNKAGLPARLKSYLRGWFGVGSDDGQDGGPVDRGMSDSGACVTPRTALSLAAVWACTRLLSQTIATLPLGLFERVPGESPRPADDLPIARLLSIRPNADMTAVVFWESIIGQALLLGNGFGEKKYLGNRLVAIELLSASRLTWRRLAGGALQFTYIDKTGTTRQIREQDIFHVPGFTLWGKFGMSVIRYGAQVFGAAISTNQAANSTFKNGLLATTFFKMERILNKEQRNEFRTNLETIRGSLNAGKQPLLEGGMDVGELGINPDDAQLLESRAFSTEEVCRWFGVPPSMIGSTDKASSWASSSEQLNLWFLKYTLRPWLKRIEQAVWMQLLTPAEQARYFAEFQVEGLLRADTTARANFYASALQNGYMNRDTVARLENLPKPTGGDVYTVQSNLVPVDKLGQSAAPASTAAADALKAWLGITEGKNHDDPAQE